MPLFHIPGEAYVPQIVRLDAWLEPRGLCAWEGLMPPIAIENLFALDEYLPQELYILGGFSPRGRGHVVVAYGGYIVHDPHPSRAGLVSADAFMVIGLR